MIKTKKDNKLAWLIGALIIVLIYGGNQGWFKTILNSSTINQYNSTTVSTPAKIESIPVVTDTALTCAQKAAKASAYYTEQFTTAKQCLDYSALDCKDKGKVILGYAMVETCCYYTCEAAAPPVQQPVALPINTIFVSSKGYRGNLGGMAGADAKCMALASAANLQGSWMAIVSTSTVSAKIRLSMNDASYWDIKGNDLSINTAGLFDNGMDDIIYADETGTPTQGNVWTGTVNSGDSSALTCNDWTDATAGSTAMYGQLGTATSWWIAGGIDNCDHAKKIYCVKTNMNSNPD